ncbi:MAG: hypothetical protein MZV63_34755 [Marinilabiliales bacterium]|nr:hypothetical protein [Marinilabiliales bacterium]
MVLFAAVPVKGIGEMPYQDKFHQAVLRASTSQFGHPDNDPWPASHSLPIVTFSLTGRKKFLSGVAGLGVLYEICSA